MLDIKTVKLKTEEEIMGSWGNSGETVVSVVCTTFNHESYIEDAIISFLMQETDFAFEVIIHDDASTDKTVEIVKKYQEEYPNLIKPIFQEENQYSKGEFKPLIYAMSFAAGEYLALCEGDDFWVDKAKISKQVLKLVHSGLNLCFSSCFFIEGSGEVTKKECLNKDFVSVDDIILGGGSYIPTASILVRRKALLELPDWFGSAPVGDYFIQVIGSYPFGADYIQSETCCYRVEAVGSWSSKQGKYINKVRHYLDMISSLFYLKNDYPDRVVVIDQFIGVNYFWLAKESILNKRFNKFRYFSLKSYEYYQSMNREQVYFYYMSKFTCLFPLLYFVFLMKNEIKSLLIRG